MAFLFRVLRKTDQKTVKNDIEWRMHEIMGVICGVMFGEERVNNSVNLLSRVLVAFWVRQISALVTVTHFAATCCYRCLNVNEPAVTHASLAFFSRRTNTSSVLHALRACMSHSSDHLYIWPWKKKRGRYLDCTRFGRWKLIFPRRTGRRYRPCFNREQ